MNPVSELAFFSQLVAAGSLAATARELNLTPPAVTKRLAQLEKRLGVRLLNRTTRSISLTAEGETYLINAKRILGEIEEMERQVSSSRAEPKGLLRVNAPLGFGRTHVGPAISLFAKRYPEVEVQLHLTDRPIHLPDDAIDVAIRFGELPDADSTTLGHPAHAHLDTRSTRTWTPDPRPLGQAVGAQRRRVALLV